MCYVWSEKKLLLNALRSRDVLLYAERATFFFATFSTVQRAPRASPARGSCRCPCSRWRGLRRGPRRTYPSSWLEIPSNSDSSTFISYIKLGKKWNSVRPWVLADVLVRHIALTPTEDRAVHGTYSRTLSKSFEVLLAAVRFQLLRTGGVVTYGCIHRSARK